MNATHVKNGLVLSLIALHSRQLGGRALCFYWREAKLIQLLKFGLLQQYISRELMQLKQSLNSKIKLKSESTNRNMDTWKHNNRALLLWCPARTQISWAAVDRLRALQDNSSMAVEENCVIMAQHGWLTHANPTENSICNLFKQIKLIFEQ